ncbi:hypothetical protein BH23VER1_BH23VER1_06810 [soil metagenome]
MGIWQALESGAAQKSGEGIAVRYDGGVHLPEPDLWLDPHGPRSRAFVSHAHADHFARHAEIVCSVPTRDLIAARYGVGAGKVVRAVEFGDSFVPGPGFTARLVPAGHIVGSAQIWIRRERDGASLLYTGDFKVREGLSAERCEAVRADTLVMETTFGRPQFRFPPADEVVAAVVKFARESVEDGEVPVLLGYSLGKAQEILAALAGAGLPVMLHKSVAEMTAVYRRLRPGVGFPEYREFDGAAVAGHVLVFPPGSARSQAIRKIRNRRVAMLTGWAMAPGAKFRYQVDEVFPLSDHADYPDLLRYVEMVRPQRVLTLHGYAHEFARDLRERGVEAWSVLQDNQLELALDERGGGGDDGGTGTGVEPALPPHPDSGFGGFVRVAEAIASATGRLEKVALLSAFLSGLDEDADEDLARAVTFLTGRPIGRAEVVGAIQVGRAVVKRALREASGIPEERYREISASQNDAGRTTFLVLGHRPGHEGRSLAEIADFFARLQEARGPLAKGDLLRDLLAAIHPRDGQFVVKILAGDLRIGLKDGLVEEAVAKAFGADPAEVRGVAMLTGDLGHTAVLARRGRLAEAGITPFVPLKVMLASPEESADGMWKRLGGADGGGSVWLEDKFDGIRAQIHRRGGRAELYSRDLRPLTAEFPEVAAAALNLDADVILDGEIIAYADGRRLTFFDLQKRLGRHQEGDLFRGESVPVRFVVFDVLWKDGTSLLDLPLTRRREALDALDLPENFGAAGMIRAGSAAAIEAAFSAARRRGNEGLVAKDPGSPYSPGRRGMAWLKLKKALATLDCVVVAAEQGHGKRSHVLSDYTFAVRDESTGTLATLGKAYSGLTDIEIERLTEHFRAHTVERLGRRKIVVEPDTVLEIAFDSIRASRRHDSGLALRFPRIKALRPDKSAAEIDTLDYARRLAGVVPGEA